MCGIAGEVNFESKASLSIVSALNEAMKHRGPDDSGTFRSASNACTLAHRRLSIIDLSFRGRQPMTTPDGRYTIVFNGEIYNYRELKTLPSLKGLNFHSESDTEVLLQLFAHEGISCLEKIRGMFAFGIWDEQEQILTLARDPFGIKPLYYLVDKGRLVFASEIKALRKIGLASGLDPIGLGLFLRWGSIPSPQTIYQNVKSLPSGTWMKFSKNKLEEGKYWSFREILEQSYLGKKGGFSDRQEVLSFVRKALIDSVKSHLVSDVPVGAFLSGGVDSSAVVSLMRQAGQNKIATFSVIFDNPAYNESKYARLAAATYQTEHYEQKFGQDEFFSMKNDFFNSFDQPTVDGVNTFVVARLSSAFNFKVVTSGVGGDEFFAGYPTIFRDLPKLIRRLQKLPAPLKNISIRFLDAFRKKAVFSSKWLRIRALLTGPPDLFRGYDLWRTLFSSEEIKELLSDRALAEEVAAIDTCVFLDKDLPELSDREKLTMLEVSRYLGSQLLPDSDIFSMAHSQELRVPLVDKVLAGNLATLSDDQMFLNNNVYNKPLLVEAVGDIPKEIAYRKKMGFTFPLQDWLKLQHWQPRHPLLNPISCGKINELFHQGKLHWSRRWALEVLDYFLMQNFS